MCVNRHSFSWGVLSMCEVLTWFPRKNCPGFFLELKGNVPCHHFQMYVGVVLSVRHTIGLMCPCEVCYSVLACERYTCTCTHTMINNYVHVCLSSVCSKSLDIEIKKPCPLRVVSTFKIQNYPPVYLKLNTSTTNHAL